MKESKSAGFTNLSFSADFDGGKLVSLTAILASDTLKPTMSAEETWELFDWIRSEVLKAGGEVSNEDTLRVPEAYPPEPAYQNGLLSLEDRSTKTPGAVAGGRKISDAESVAHRVPLEKALSAGGMVLETKPINPIVVNIGGTSKL